MTSTATTISIVPLGVCVARGWDRLREDAGAWDPLRTGERLEAWDRLCGDGGSMVPTAWRGGRLVGAWPLAVRARRGGVRVCEPLGEPGQWLDPGPVALDAEAHRAVVAAARRVPADVLRVHALPASAASSDALRLGLPGVSVRSGPPMFRVRLGEEAPVRGRRRRVRKSVNRAAREGTPITSTALRTADEVLPRIDEVLDFHARHWRTDLPNALVGTPGRRAFNAETLRSAASRDAVRLALSWMGPDLVAFQLGLVAGSHGLTYTGTYDRSRRNVSGLGWLGTLTLIEAFREDGLEWLEMGIGSDEFKSEIALPHATWDLMAPLSARGRVASAAVAVREAVRSRRPGGAAPDDGAPVDADDGDAE